MLEMRLFPSFLNTMDMNSSFLACKTDTYRFSSHSSKFMFVILRCRWSTQLQPFVPHFKNNYYAISFLAGNGFDKFFGEISPSLGKRCSSIGFSHSLVRWKSRGKMWQITTVGHIEKVLQHFGWLNVCRSVVKHLT